MWDHINKLQTVKHLNYYLQ